MVLLKQKVGQDPARQCDSRCYNAKCGTCACICGGRNHGAGIQKALDNVRTMFAPVVLCIHEKIVGTCDHGCSEPKGRVGDVRVPRKALRELNRVQEMKASA